MVDGVAELRVLEVPCATLDQEQSSSGQQQHDRAQGPPVKITATSSPPMRRLVANVKPGAATPSISLADIKPIRNVRVTNQRHIEGPYLNPVQGSLGRIARVTAVEGMWEHTKGRIVDGGERRKAEVRAKRRVQERKMAKT